MASPWAAGHGATREAPQKCFSDTFSGGFAAECCWQGTTPRMSSLLPPGQLQCVSRLVLSHGWLPSASQRKDLQQVPFLQHLRISPTIHWTTARPFQQGLGFTLGEPCRWSGVSSLRVLSQPWGRSYLECQLTNLYEMSNFSGKYSWSTLTILGQKDETEIEKLTPHKWLYWGILPNH